MVFDLTRDDMSLAPSPDAVSKAMNNEICELERFTERSLPVLGSLSLPAEVAIFEADIMLIENPVIPSAGSSRSLPKQSKGNGMKSKQAKPKAKAKSKALMQCIVPQGVHKSSAKKLATSRAWHSAKKAALAAGRSDSVASKMARAAYRKVAAEYKKKETGGLKDW